MKAESSAKNVPSISMESFFIKAKSTDGRKLSLSFPDGTDTEFYVVVRGRYCDEVSKAIDEYNRVRLLNHLKPESEKASDAEMILLPRAAMLTGWNLPDEYNPENVAKFLSNAPQIAEAIDKFSWKDSNFL